MQTETINTSIVKPSYTTKIEKGYYDKQWSAKTYIQLDQPDRQLKVSTFKSNRGLLYTSCQAMKVSNNSESYMMFGDYDNDRKAIMQFPEIKRVTDKNIAECHNKALEIIETFVNAANEFYTVKG